MTIMKLKFYLAFLLVFGTLSAVNAQRLWGVASSGVADNKGVVFSTTNTGTGYNVEKAFNSDFPGANPLNSLTLAPNGKLYGMTTKGGSSNLGVIFEFDPATGGYVKRFDFSGTADGASPQGGFVLVGGLLYGMTTEGGATGNGILFSYSPGATSITKKFDFNGTNGSAPIGTLVKSSSTTFLYGVTSAGGTGDGVLFEYDPSGSTPVVKHNFSSSSDGAGPAANLVEASNGKLYGMAVSGGSAGMGTLFEYNPSSPAFTKKVDFNGSNGAAPYGSLVSDGTGTVLYGMTSGIGSGGLGTIFSYVPGDTFVSVKISLDNASGSVPFGSLMRASNNMYYGMTLNGGANSYGVIFEYDGVSAYSKKFDFDPNVNGGNPQGSLTEAGGKLYGMAGYNGPVNSGTLFEFDQSTYVFTKKVDFSNASQGSNPVNGLTVASGMLYGTTSTGGVNGFGTIYEINPTGSVFTKKVDFALADGILLSSGLTLASNGKLYGVASGGGANGDGTLFEYVPGTTSITVKYNFASSTSGDTPTGTLCAASNGKLYGTTRNNGVGGRGTIFEFDPSTGGFVTQYGFSGGSDGDTPYGGLIQAANGTLYGMTNLGGINSKGILYQYDVTMGTFTKLKDFSFADGQLPYGELLQGANGKLYGVTSGGGSTGDGVLFEYDYAATSPLYTVKFNFDNTGASTGAIPQGTLFETSNGVFFGTTNDGGAGGKGVVFKYDLAGGYTIMNALASNGSQGAAPQYGALSLVPPKQSQTISFGPIANKQVGDVFTLPATATPSGLTISYTSSDPSVASIVGNTVTVNAPGTITITASQGGNATYKFAQNVTQSLTVAKASQTITFTLSSPVTYSPSGTISLNGTASSGLTVSYVSSDPTVASISGNTLTILKTSLPIGITITAKQSGNASYDPAPDVQQTLVINKANQTITFVPITPIPAHRTYGTTFTIDVTVDSGLPLSFSASPAIVSVSGSSSPYTVTILGPSNQSTTITASQAGNGNYNAATNATGVVTIDQASQTITFNPLAIKTYGDAPFNLTGSASSGLPLTYSVPPSNGVASISGNTVTILGAGTVQITPSQAGDANYLPAGPIGPPNYQVLTVNKGSQTITFSSLPNKAPTDPDFTLSATSSSGLPISYTSSNPSVATIAGSTVHIVGVGSTDITANQSGDTNYNAATPVIQTQVVAKLNQTITFSPLPSKGLSDPDFTLSATSDSGLPISYTSSNPLVATITGNTVHIVGAGSTNITANQAGNATYNSATPVVQALVVTTKLSQTITFNAIPSKKLGSGTFTLVATASSSLPVSYVSGNTAVATITGNTVTLVGIGTTTITASQGGDATYNAAPSVDQNLVVTKGDQTISFQITANPLVGGTFTLTGTSSSGLPLTYQVISGSISISGTTVTGSAAGSATIRASQAGNANYNAAADVDATFCVRPLQPTITASGSTLTSSSSASNNWYFNGTATGETTQSITATKSGNYTVQVVAVGGCVSDISAPLVFTGDLNDPVTSFIVFPNPAKDRIVVDLHEFQRETVELKIIDQKGQPLYTQKVTGGDAVEVGIAEHAAGLYILIAAQGDKILRARYIKGQ